MPFKEIDNQIKQTKDLIERTKINNEQLKASFWGNDHEQDRLNAIKLNEEGITSAEHTQQRIENFNKNVLKPFKKK